MNFQQLALLLGGALILLCGVFRFNAAPRHPAACEQGSGLRAPREFAVGANPTGLAAGDFNGDGAGDLAVIDGTDGFNGNALNIWVGTGRGDFGLLQSVPLTLTSTGNATFRSLLAADFNRDGKLDLAVAGVSESIALFQGSGDGSFAAPLLFRTNNRAPLALAAADFNGDGLPDLASLFTGGDAPLLLVRHGVTSGGFGAPNLVALNTNFPPRALLAADFNADGKPDLALSGPFFRQVLLLYNAGNGTFTPQPPLTLSDEVRAMAAGDFNRDGKTDLTVTTDRGALIYLNEGQGTFPAMPTRLNFNPAQAVLVNDFDQDGRADWLLESGSYGLSLVLGDGLGGARHTVNYGYTQQPILPVSGDFNRDGKPDVAVLQRTQQSCAVLLNDGTGALPAPTVQNPFMTLNGFALRDLNQDGKLDLVLATTQGVTLLPGNGQGGFGVGQSATNNLSLDSAAVAVADFNHDNRLDIAALLSSSFGQPTRVALLMRLANDSFASPRSFELAPTSVQTTELITADFNRDGNPDLAVANALTNEIVLLTGDGRGNLARAVTFPVGLEPRSLALADFNADGNPDLAVANRNSATLTLLRGDGRGGFESTFLGIGANPRQVLAQDFNRDGKVDLAVAHNNAVFVSLLLGNGDGTFGAPRNTYIEGLPNALIAADFNNDGRLDLAVAQLNQGNTPALLRVFAGDGMGAFSLIQQTAVPSAAGLETADFNGDGLPELALRHSSQVWFFANSCHPLQPRDQLINLSAASFRGAVLAPESIIAAFGTDLSTQTASATTQPLPLQLGGTTVKVKDRLGVELSAPLFFVSPTQINYLLPRGLTAGLATVTTTNSNGALSREQLQLSPTAPAFFTANADGQGVPAGFALRVRPADQGQTIEPLAQLDTLSQRFVPRPVRPGDINGFVDELYLVLFGTGWRNSRELSVRLGTTECEVVFTGPQGTLAGLDQINLRLRLPPGNNVGEFPVVITADGKPSTPVKVLFQYP